MSEMNLIPVLPVEIVDAHRVNAFPNGVTVSIQNGVRIGFSHDRIYFTRRIPYEKRNWEWCVVAENGQTFEIVAADMTVEIRNYMQQITPNWFDVDFVIEHCHQYDELKKLSHEQRGGIYAKMPPGRTGRFTTTNSGLRGYACWCLRDVLWKLSTWKSTTPNAFLYTPDVELLTAFNPTTIWSDGMVVSDRTLLAGTMPDSCHNDLSNAAKKLLAVAARQKEWLDGGKWRHLMMTGSFTTRRLECEEVGGYGWSEKKTLDEIRTDNGLTLWHFHHEGGAMGEDGDSWEWGSIYDIYATAKSQYDRDNLTT